jgi:hypothetical protein
MILAAGLVLGAGIAKADSHGWPGDRDASAYALELNAAGLSTTPSSASGAASTVCWKRAEGYSEALMIQYLVDPPRPMPRWAATVAITGAEYHFCPQYAGSLAPRSGGGTDISYPQRRGHK